MKEPGYHTRSLILQRPAKVSGELDRTQAESCVGQVLTAHSCHGSRVPVKVTTASLAAEGLPDILSGVEQTGIVGENVRKQAKRVC